MYAINFIFNFIEINISATIRYRLFQFPCSITLIKFMEFKVKDLSCRRSRSIKRLSCVKARSIRNQLTTVIREVVTFACTFNRFSY